MFKSIKYDMEVISNDLRFRPSWHEWGGLNQHVASEIRKEMLSNRIYLFRHPRIEHPCHSPHRLSTQCVDSCQGSCMRGLTDEEKQELENILYDPLWKITNGTNQV